MPTGRSRSIC